MIASVYAEKKKEEELESEYELEKSKNIKWYDRVLLNRAVKVLTTFILLAMVGPLVLYRFLFFATRDLPPSDGFSTGSCLVPRNSRLSCGVGHMTEAQCHQQCCFDPGHRLCFHRLPSRFSYIVDKKWSEEAILQPRVSTVPYALQNSKTNLKLSINEQSPTHLTLTFYDSKQTSLTGNRIDSKNYAYEVTSPELNVVVSSTQRTVFNMARGPLIASDNIWEITFQLTNETMYGLGELPLKPGDTKVLYNHNQGLNSIPLIFAKINESYHGVLIDAISPAEVSVQGNNNIVIRSITNFGLKLHVFMGPQPKDVMNDVVTLTGDKIKLEYWMLGAHICRETSTSGKLADDYEYLQKFIYYANREEVPFESHCGTRPVVFNANECYVDEAKYIQKGIDLLNKVGKRFVPHVSPYIRFNKNLTMSEGSDDQDCYKIVANNENLFYRHQNKLYQGLVGDDKVLYPAYEYASEQFIKELWKYNGSLDGFILVNSWPLDQSNKTHDETIKHLPYFTQNISSAFDETPPWNLQLKQDPQLYLQNHNKYGNYFANAFQKILKHTVPIWSSSHWMKSNVVTNRQNIDTSWASLHEEIIQAALGGISGNWLWASPTCGDTDNIDLHSQANLCVKWYMATVFFPILKIHSKSTSRDPLAFVGTHERLISAALKRRLSLLPYLFSILQVGPILRPMFYQFPNVKELADVDTQFSVGDDLLIVPNLQPLQKFVHFWLPPGTWYELWSGLRLEGEVGQAVTMSTTEADFLTVVRGGSIIVTQKDTRETAEETRLHSAMSVTVALECKNIGSLCLAVGLLFVTDDVQVIFRATEHKLMIEIIGDDNSVICDSSKVILNNSINEIYVFGLDEKLNNFDHHKYIEAAIDLCSIENNNVIFY